MGCGARIELSSGLFVGLSGEKRRQGSEGEREREREREREKEREREA